MPALTLARLRAQAIRGSLFAPTTLTRAIESFGFVQADPIRAPARAQDLILRHRVADYRAGDLERRFPRLALEEDFFYAYGFMPRATRDLLHPRHDPAADDGRFKPHGLAADVLAFVRANGATHPRALEQQFGKERVVNGWGGQSKATTRVLDSLHYHGLLRVARRQDGIRVYEAAPPPAASVDEPVERLRQLVLLIVRILAPISASGLRATLALMDPLAPGLPDLSDVVDGLLQSGALETGELDRERYLWPAASAGPRSGARRVRFLAPFDPVVWDRRRFAHLWEWEYRFEAYTPPAKRRLGYYAMPLLWGDDVVGWVNCTVREGRLDVTAGYTKPRPRGPDFRNAFDAEVARMEAFLSL